MFSSVKRLCFEAGLREIAVRIVVILCGVIPGVRVRCFFVVPLTQGNGWTAQGDTVGGMFCDKLKAGDV